MPGIPDFLSRRLREALVDSGSFRSDQVLQAVFAHQWLRPWKNNVPEASSPLERADLVIAAFHEVVNVRQQKSVLVLLLCVLAEQFDEADARRGRLSALADELEGAAADLPQERHDEANPDGSTMTFVGTELRLLRCADAIARVSVPRFTDGQMGERIPTGTGWLVTPALAITCWHVAAARNTFRAALSDGDLAAQVANAVFAFDYVAPGDGVEYGVERLEHYNPRLDYALFRLQDRADAPLAARGCLALDEDAPLTAQMQFYVLQHPRGASSSARPAASSDCRPTG